MLEEEVVYVIRRTERKIVTFNYERSAAVITLRPTGFKAYRAYLGEFISVYMLKV